jgi:cytochrome c5
MHNPLRHPASRFTLVVGIAIGVVAAQAASAAEEAEAVQEATAATTEVVAKRLSGLQVYQQVCIACHSPPGVGGAPALGNAEAWTPRIAQGMDTLISHALNGFSGKTGVMPRKGERPDLSDEEIIGAIEYMVGQITAAAQ